MKIVAFLFSLLWAALACAQSVVMPPNGGPASAASTCFAYDTFTGTNGTDLNAHTGNDGITWSRAGGTTNAAVIDTSTSPDSARGNVLGSVAFYKNTGTPVTADYTVEGTIHLATGVTGTLSIGGRLSNSDVDYYRVIATYGSPSTIQLFRSGTQLGSNVNETFANGDVVKLIMTGSTIKANYNGTDVITQTDTNITAVGVSMLRFNSDSTDGPWIQGFKAYANGGSCP
jgi:hypothetical protein